MCLVTRKPVFAVFNQVRLQPACSATEASESHEIANIETREIILSRLRTTKALISLHRCAGWSAPLLIAYGINRFSHVGAHMVKSLSRFQYYSSNYLKSQSLGSLWFMKYPWSSWPHHGIQLEIWIFRVHGPVSYENGGGRKSEYYSIGLTMA